MQPYNSGWMNKPTTTSYHSTIDRNIERKHNAVANMENLAATFHDIPPSSKAYKIYSKLQSYEAKRNSEMRHSSNPEEIKQKYDGLIEGLRIELITELSIYHNLYHPEDFSGVNRHFDILR